MNKVDPTLPSTPAKDANEHGVPAAETRWFHDQGNQKDLAAIAASAKAARDAKAGLSQAEQQALRDANGGLGSGRDGR